MAHNSRIRADLAAWANGSAVLNTDYDTLDQAQFESINGDKGGIWVPANKIILSGALGASLELQMPFKAYGTSAHLAALQAQNWPERAAFSTTALNNTPLAVAWLPSVGGSPLYVVLDTAKKIYTSTDGVGGWVAGPTLANLGTLKPELSVGQLDGASIFLATGGPDFYTSADGAAWTDRTPLSIASSGCSAYSASLNRWVFVSSSNIDYATGTTAGFAAWAAATVPAAWASNSGGCSRLVWNGSLFVALPVGSYNKCLTSPDGINWTERTLPATAIWTGLAYSTYDGVWMACASNYSAVATSANGTAWLAAASANLYVGNDLAVNGPLWVIPTLIANGGGIVWSVDRGANWNRATAVGNHRTATAGWKRILSADGRFVVTHCDGTNIELALSLRSS